MADGEPERGPQPERDGVTVRDGGVRRARLQRMREGVAEVERDTDGTIVRIAHAHGGLVRSAAAHNLRVGQLPETLAREQAGLDDFGQATRALVGGQGLEQHGVDDGARGPVERADEVLRRRQVDAGLAADRRVHLTHERRRHGDPREAAQVRGGREAGDVGGTAAAERDERSPAV